VKSPTVETFEEALIQMLLSQSWLTNLVGDRIYPQTLDFGGAFPSLTISSVSNVGTFSQEGHSGFTRERISIDVFAKDYQAMGRVAKALKDNLKDVRTTLAIGDGVYRIDGVLFQNQIDGYHAGPKLHHRVLDFLVMHSE
jgi:fermentation-respiration switch protein FrsA (DUF1100 family)